MRLKIEATLLTEDGSPLEGKTIEFYRSTDGQKYEKIDEKTTDSSGKAVTYDYVESGTVYYKAVFPGDDLYEPSEAYASYTVTQPTPTPTLPTPTPAGVLLPNWIMQLLALLIIVLVIILIIKLLK